MDKEDFRICRFCWDGDDKLNEEIEVASIFSDVALKKQSDKKLLIFKNTPERISFISKLYFPLRISQNGDLSFVLGTSFFSRTIRDYKLDKNRLDNRINDILKDRITIQNLKMLNGLLGEKGFLGKITGKEKENYTEFKIKGGYPNKYPNNLMEEFKLMEKIFNSQRDGIVFQQGIPDSVLENSATRLRSKLAEIESDINYIKEKKMIISNIVDILEKQKNEINEHYKQLHTEILEDCNNQDIDISINTAQAISVIEREFESNINMFARYYPLLHQGLINPTEFGGWTGLTSDIYSYQKSDRKYQAIAANLLGKIRTCKNIVNRLKPEQGQPHPQTASFVNQVYEMADDSEKQLYKRLDYASNVIKEIWAKEEAFRDRWNSEVKQVEDSIKVLLEEQKEILKRLDLILTSKKSTIEEIKANIALPANALSNDIYIPFWIACLSRQNECRFLVYEPMRKREDKGLMYSLQGYTMPLRPYSRGIKKLKSEIEAKLKQDKNLAAKIINEGNKYNKLNPRYIELVIKGLETLKSEGWIKEKQINNIIQNIKQIQISDSFGE